MLERCSIGAMALGLALGAAVAGAWAHDESQYPDLKGQWVGLNAKADAPWDPIKPPGRAQQAPLTPEYQAIFEATLARQAQGALNPNTCLPPGMPRTMIVHQPMEIIVMPDTTYMMLSYMSEFRRIYTDGRKWPEDIEPAYAGYSIGQWERAAGDGRYDTLVIELKYGRSRDRVISGLKRVSKPGRRIYARREHKHRVMGGMGIAILSTSRGIMTSRRAQEEGVGGEVIAFVW